MSRKIKEQILVVATLAALYTVTGNMFYLAVTRHHHMVTGLDVVRLVIFILMVPLLMHYFLQLIGAFLYPMVVRKRQRRQPLEALPSVSVLIPAWNEEVGIVKTIESVVNTRYPDLQVVVINDGSTDGTDEKIKGFIADQQLKERDDLCLKYLRFSNGGKARAINRGLKHAQGEIIVTVDADSVMAPDAIHTIVKHFNDPKVGAVAGNVVVGNRRKSIGWMQQMEYLSGFFLKRGDALFNSVYIIGGAAAAYRREVLEEMGDFDHEIITEDIEMSVRILGRGYKTRYAADAVVYTEGPSDLWSLCNQRLRWKHGRIQTFIKHRNLFFSRQPQHNPYFSFLQLPFAVYAELMSLALPMILTFFAVHTVVSSNWVSFAASSALLSVLIGSVTLVDPLRSFHRNQFWCAPVAWFVFVFVSVVEFSALVRSLMRLAKRQELKWQKWIRVGLLDDASSLG